jgi:hypothetical protein
MSKSTKRNANRITNVIDAWTRLRPTKSFAGLTLAEFKAAVQPSLDTRAAHVDAVQQTADAAAQRDNADAASLPVVDRVVAGVVADQDEGYNGELFQAMGYVRKRDRASGLTRASRTSAPQLAVAKAA